MPFPCHPSIYDVLPSLNTLTHIGTDVRACTWCVSLIGMGSTPPAYVDLSRAIPPFHDIAPFFSLDTYLTTLWFSHLPLASASFSLFLYSFTPFSTTHANLLLSLPIRQPVLFAISCLPWLGPTPVVHLSYPDPPTVPPSLPLEWTGPGGVDRWG